MKSRQLTGQELGKIQVQRICLRRPLAEFALHLCQPASRVALTKLGNHQLLKLTAG